VKKFFPVQAGLLIFGKNASKSAWVNHVAMPLPLGPEDGAVVGELGALVDATAEVAVVVGATVVVASVPAQPTAFQVDSALQ
jgi:hypothetical protein